MTVDGHTLASVMVLLVGATLCLAGWRVYHGLSRLIGFLIGAGFVLVVGSSLLSPVLAPRVVHWVVLGAAALAGVVSFFLFGVLRRLLVFLTGFLIGVLITQAVSGMGAQPEAVEVLAYGLPLARLTAFQLLMGILGGVILVIFERLFVVVVTSLLGALLIATWFRQALLLPLLAGAGILVQLVSGRKGKQGTRTQGRTKSKHEG